MIGYWVTKMNTVEYSGKEHPTDPTITHLINAVTESHPSEAELSGLADEWLERGDSRGHILYEWLNGNRSEVIPNRWHGSVHDERGRVTTPDRQVEHTKSVAEHRYPYGWGTPDAFSRVIVQHDPTISPHFRIGLHLESPRSGRYTGTHYIIEVPHHKAKELLSNLGKDPGGRYTYEPNGEDTQRWLDERKPQGPEQLSRDKPLVISYNRNPNSLKKKYAVSTVGRVFGQGKSSSEVSSPMVGSRLATVLQEIRHGTGKDNPRLQQLTQAALGGSHKGDVYTGIRDELFRTKDPRAVALARQYNWHKVGEGLERDKHLRDFVKASAEGTKHQNHHQMYRRFYNGIVHGKEGPDERTRALFYKHMQTHLKNQIGKDHSYEQIEDSLRRLGETEENHESIKRNTSKPQSKFEVPDYQNPAYTGVPKEGKFPRKDQTTPRNKLHVGQFKRRRWSYKLND